MSKMITNLATTVLYEADKRLDTLITTYFNVLKQDLQNARDLVWPGSRLMTCIEGDEVYSDVVTFGRLCSMQRILRDWYEGAPECMSFVHPETVKVLQRLDEAMTQDQISEDLSTVIDVVLRNCPNWTFGTPPVEAEVLPPGTVDATEDADIPHTTDTGEDA
jgi:hypothetical protein